jgi:uncharacterized protein YbcI
MYLRSGKSIHSVSPENMVLRSGTQLCYSSLEERYSNHFVSNSSDIFDDWLINRMKNIVSIMQSINRKDNDNYMIERARVLDEFCYLLTEYFEDIVYDLDEPTLIRMAEKIGEWVKEITSDLFETSGYSDFERNYLGNVRASIVSLQVRLLNRL